MSFNSQSLVVSVNFTNLFAFTFSPSKFSDSFNLSSFYLRLPLLFLLVLFFLPPFAVVFGVGVLGGDVVSIVMGFAGIVSSLVESGPAASVAVKWGSKNGKFPGFFVRQQDIVADLEKPNIRDSK